MSKTGNTQGRGLLPGDLKSVFRQHIQLEEKGRKVQGKRERLLAGVIMMETSMHALVIRDSVTKQVV